MHSSWGKLHLNPTSPAGLHKLLPPLAEETVWIIPWTGHHLWLWLHVLSNECSQAHRILRKKCHGTSKEWTSRVCQLWWPRSQAAQIELLKQLFPFCGNLLCLDALDLIQCIHHARPHLGLRHTIGSYQSCYWDLLLQGLMVGHTIPYHDGDTFAAIAHLSVGILYHQTLGQWPLFGT